MEVKLTAKEKAYRKSLETRVKAGVKWLDKQFGGRSWVRKVKTTMLRMSSSTSCVIGQVYGDYWDEVARRGDIKNGYRLSYREAVKFGFISKRYNDFGDFGSLKEQKEFDLLTSTWINKIGQLRKR